MEPHAPPTVFVKSFAHLKRNFFLASMEEIGKLFQWWTVYSGVAPLIMKISLPNKRRQFKNRLFHTPPCSKLAPLSQGGGGSQKIHSINCAKLLTSTVHNNQKTEVPGGYMQFNVEKIFRPLFGVNTCFQTVI